MSEDSLKENVVVVEEDCGCDGCCKRIRATKE